MVGVLGDELHSLNCRDTPLQMVQASSRRCDRKGDLAVQWAVLQAAVVSVCRYILIARCRPFFSVFLFLDHFVFFFLKNFCCCF